MQKWQQTRKIFQCFNVLYFQVSRSYSSVENRATNQDLYSILKVSPNASQKQIKAAYYEQSLVLHPDHNKDSTSLAREKFHQLTEAYKVLGDTSLRKNYDRKIKVENPQSFAPFHENVIQKHTTGNNMNMNRKYDQWTLSHYQQSLVQHADRIKRDSLRKHATQEEAKRQSATYYTLFGIFCITVALHIVGRSIANKHAKKK